MNKTALIVVLAAAGASAQALQEFTIVPTEPTGSHHNSLDAAAIRADRIALKDVIAYAYGVPSVRVLGSTRLNETFSVTAKARAGQEDQFLASLQLALADRLHLRIERTAKEMPIYVAKVLNPDSLKLHAAQGDRRIGGGDGSVSFVNASIVDLGRILDRPIVDETGLTGGYTFDLEWQPGDPKSLVKSIRDQLGLTLVDDHRKVEVVIVSR
jgi:uncharacterized protein (TIGR03435 family)